MVQLIHEDPRGCGRRRRGAYAVSRAGDGELPLWVDIDPPIPYEGKQFRGVKTIDLEKTLVERTVVFVGASLERRQHATAQQDEIETFGMPFGVRTRLGICSVHGPGAFARLALRDRVALGRALRALSQHTVGNAGAQTVRAWSAWQAAVKDRKGYAPLLARLWHLWRDATPQQKPKVVPWLQMAMKAINAPEDAEALRQEYYSKRI